MFTVNNVTYCLQYCIEDDIYPKFALFVPMINGRLDKFEPIFVSAKGTVWIETKKSFSVLTFGGLCLSSKYDNGILNKLV